MIYQKNSEKANAKVEQSSFLDNKIMVQMHMSDDQALRDIPKRKETIIESEKMAASSLNNSIKPISKRVINDQKSNYNKHANLNNKNKNELDLILNNKINVSDYQDHMSEQLRQSSFFIDSPQKKQSFAFQQAQQTKQQNEQQYTFSNHASVIDDGVLILNNINYQLQKLQNEPIKKQASQIQEVNENTSNQRDITIHSKFTQNISEAYQLKSFKKKEKNTFQLIKFHIINYIFQRTLFGKTKQLSSQIRKQIGDLSDNFDDFTNNQSDGINLSKEKDNKQLKKIKLFPLFLNWVKNLIEIAFNENSLSFILYTIIITSWNIIYLYISSLQIIFDVLSSSKLQNTLMISTLSIWIIDLIVQLLIITLQKNEFLNKQHNFFQKIIARKIHIEIIPFIFEIVYLVLFQNQYMRIPLLFKILTVNIALDKIKLFLLKTLKNNYFKIDVILLFSKLLFFFHLIACIYFIIAQIQSKSLKRSYSWFDSINEPKQNDKIFQYFTAFQWAYFFGKMSSDRYGSQDQFQLFLQSFWSIFSILIFAYVFASLKNILKSYYQRVQNYTQDLKALCSYSSYSNITLSLLQEMAEDMHKKFQQKQEEEIWQEDQILSKLNKPLQQALMDQSKIQILKKYPCFWQIFSNKINKQIPHIMLTEFYNEGQIIEPLKQSDCYFYLLLQGQAEIYVKSNFVSNTHLPEESKKVDIQRILKGYSQIDNSSYSDCPFQEEQNHKEKSAKTLVSGEFFGTTELITGIKQDYFVKCTKNSIFIKIKRLELLEIIKKNDRDYQIFMEMKDRIINTQRYQFLGEKCIFCHSKDHLFSNCGMVNIDKSSSLAFMKSVQSQEQTRNSQYQRKRKLKTQFIYIEGDEEQSQSNMTLEDTIDRINSLKDQLQVNTNLMNQQYIQSLEDNVLPDLQQVMISQHSLNSSNIQIPLKQRRSISFTTHSYKQEQDVRSENTYMMPSVEDGISYQSEIYRDPSSRTLDKNKQSKLSVNTPLKRYSESNFTHKDSAQQDTISTKNEKLDQLYPSSIQNSSLIDFQADKKLNKSQFANKRKSVSVMWKDSNYNYGSLKNLNFTINQALQTLDTCQDKWKFDFVKEFKYYYPRYNISNILNKFSVIQTTQKIIQKSKQKRSIFEIQPSTN
ncbi:cyclic nucleotide-binding domain protein (macronuclear) [Tetrahymena thermophila SB210]|uniref:Cyclic nucleotide-binding domain protein n=1 Tax=Tetrahymena thermophila (strain SB210) TaxID=312017 RepID=I7LY05_TETTS|nr:cyclic nucleotide-binding domain protein [Tetrahymena thermophila SB210]EAS07109.2 cyclic nucleotide-binding domain protein [Tetrahymena thermophila SB210]|eukprot:XP_001027351.2 cyclic nucleotide-binding domain protein [Tetrahymena thermophila SB210]